MMILILKMMMLPRKRSPYNKKRPTKTMMIFSMKALIPINCPILIIN